MSYTGNEQLYRIYTKTSKKFISSKKFQHENDKVELMR
jgi:hypothetical protein